MGEAASGREALAAFRELKLDVMVMDIQMPEMNGIDATALIRRGNRLIGAQLGISEATVKVHMKNVLSKMGANDRTHAVVLAVERGIIDLRGRRGARDRPEHGRLAVDHERKRAVPLRWGAVRAGRERVWAQSAVERPVGPDGGPGRRPVGGLPAWRRDRVPQGRGAHLHGNRRAAGGTRVRHPGGAARFEPQVDEVGLPAKVVFQTLFSRDGVHWIASAAGVFFRRPGEQRFTAA